jgi:hypothetical protein
VLEHVRERDVPAILVVAPSFQDALCSEGEVGREARTAKRGGDLPSQAAAGLDVDRLVDGLRAHSHALVLGELLALFGEAAFVVVTSSGGARMQEGALSLMQMARTTIAVEEVNVPPEALEVHVGPPMILDDLI